MSLLGILIFSPIFLEGLLGKPFKSNSSLSVPLTVTFYPRSVLLLMAFPRKQSLTLAMTLILRKVRSCSPRASEQWNSSTTHFLGLLPKGARGTQCPTTHGFACTMRCASCYRCSCMSSLTSAAQDAPHSPKAFSGDRHIQHASLEILQHRLGSVKAVIHGGDDHACGSSLHPPAAVQTCVGTQQPGSVLHVATTPVEAGSCFGCHSKLRAVEEFTLLWGQSPLMVLSGICVPPDQH